MQNPQIIIIAGPNGAGKSTLAPMLLRDRLGLLEYVNADTIAQGLSAFQPEGAAIASGRVMLKRLRQLADARVSFAFETTLATRSYAPWLKDLQRHGYGIQLIFLWLRSPDLAVERVRMRVADGGHDVPEPVVRRRYVRGIRNFLGLYREVAESWGVFDNSEMLRPILIAWGFEAVDGGITRPDLWDEFCQV